MLLDGTERAISHDFTLINFVDCNFLKIKVIVALNIIVFLCCVPLNST